MTSTIIFPVSLLYIQLDVNVGGNKNSKESNMHLFKRSMLKMPKMNTKPILTSEYPFFTKNVRYPRSIERADWRTKYEFFFNRPLFIERLRQEIDANPSIYRERLTPKKDASKTEVDDLYKWTTDTEMHNVMVTLRSIFPIPDFLGKSLRNSYQHVLMEKQNSRILLDLNVRNAVNIFGFMYKFGIASKEKEEYFINIDGKRYMVDDVIWKNDIINHPVYSRFLSSQRETYEEVAKSTEEVEETYGIYLKKLNDELRTLLDTELMQKDFYKIENDCKDALCNDINYQLDMFAFFKTNIKKSNADQFYKTVKTQNELEYKDSIKYLLHYYYFRIEYENLKNLSKDDYNKMSGQQKKVFDAFMNKYASIDKTYDHRNFPNNIASAFSNDWFSEVTSLYDYLYLDDTDFEYDDIEDYISDKLIDQMYNDLKVDTILMMRLHVLSKVKTSVNSIGQSGRITMNADRINTANTVADKLDRLSKETGENAADIILSIREDFDSHLQLHRGEGVNIFMERDYEMLFERLLKMAIEIKAAKIVLNFAKNNIPMNLTGKKPDGSNVSQVNQRINQHIRDYFGTEASINNQLSSNVNDVFEPVRKTSNRELYKVLKLFKIGDAIIKREYKLSDSDIDEYRKVLENAYDKFVQNKKVDVENIEPYLYTGVDEVKSTDKGNQNKDIRRSVYEIYVGLDLVNADFYEKSNRASCKLNDKKMEQELLYLMDPRNKTYKVLTKFRDFKVDNEPNKEPPKKQQYNKSRKNMKT